MPTVSLHTAFSVETLTTYFQDNIRTSAGRGIDGVNGLTFSENLPEKLESISSKVFTQKYRYTPYLEVIKSKGRGKTPRIISKPTVKDKLVLFAIKEELHKLFPDSIPNKLPNTYIRNIKEKFKIIDCEKTAYLKIDIKGFYDNLNREKILLNLKGISGNDEFVTLVRRALLNKTVPKGYNKKDSHKYKTATGVPQGLSISNILAEIYMKEFDDHFSKKGTGYFRYVDDILIFSDINEIEKIEGEIYSKLSDIDLNSHDYDDGSRKSEKGSIKDNFQYLGYEINSSSITVKNTTVNRYIESIISMFTNFKNNAERREKESKFLNIEQIKEIFILELNEKITGAISENKKYGWMFYFVEINDIYLLHKIDGIIKKQFGRLSLFSKKAPENRSKKNINGLCSLLRTYYAIRHDLFGGYIHNYSIYETRAEKLSYLVKFGYIAHYDDKSFSDEEIEKIFISAKKSKLLKLELDVGNIS